MSAPKYTWAVGVYISMAVGFATASFFADKLSKLYAFLGIFFWCVGIALLIVGRSNNSNPGKSRTE